MLVCGHNIVISADLLAQLRAVKGADDESIHSWYQSAQEYDQPLTVEEFRNWLIQDDVDSTQRAIDSGDHCTL